MKKENENILQYKNNKSEIINFCPDVVIIDDDLYIDDTKKGLIKINENDYLIKDKSGNFFLIEKNKFLDFYNKNKKIFK